MRWMAWLGLAVLTAVVVLAGGAKGDSDSTEAQVLAVVRQGRSDVLKDRPRAICRRLTRRARKNSLRLAGLTDGPGGKRRPKPRTCVRAIGYQIDDARGYGGLKVLRRPDYRAIKVVRIIGNRAHVRLGDDTEIYLLRRKDGWRGDFGNFAPFDGSSGY
jgi:hypothetical protein